MKKISTACPRNCYSTCSFYVHVADNKVVHIDPHPHNRATPEGVCLKGLAYVERANSDQRITTPLRKQPNGSFAAISWDEAITLIADQLTQIRSRHGAKSVLYYAASGMSGLTNANSMEFWRLFGGATTMYGNLCWPAGLEATRLTLGENKHNAPWDLPNARLIIMWGKNAAESNIHQMYHIDKALEQGARFYAIDPRRTQTAMRAHRYYQIKPATDAALALAIAHVIIDNNWHNKPFIDQHVAGFEQFAAHVRQFTPQWAEKICEIPATQIHRLAKDIAHIKPMTLIPGYGMQRYTNGGQTTRAILALQVITGNIGKPGATWHYANLQSYVFDNIKEPESYYPPKKPDGIFRRTISMAQLGADMLAQKSPQLQMIWVERGNPLTQNPDTNTIRKAFDKLQFRVVVDQFLTDTAQAADLVLPAKNMFEQDDIIGSYWNPYIQFKPKVTQPAGQVKTEIEIYHLLARQPGIISDTANNTLLKPDDASIRAFLEQQVARFGELSMQKLEQGPQLANSHEAIAFADLKFATPSGKIELYSEQAKQQWSVHPLPCYQPPAELHQSPTQEFPFYLMSPNTKNRIHSQFGNLRVIRALAPEPVIYLNPDDAHRLNISAGQKIRVYNKRGQIIVKTAFDYGLRPYCLVFTNGWWASQGASPNFLSLGRETDMGHGTAFHDNMVQISKE